ncbi:MAG: phage tail protein, partial [Bacteroidales bacterium]
PTITALNTKIEGIVGGAVISATPPVSPKEGVTWFCTEDARTYIWYKDEDDTVQWVDQNPDRIIIENIGGVPLLSVMWFPNRAMIASGYIPADGQLVTKALYPDAWDKINTGIVPTVPDASWIADPLNRGAYTTGTTTQFRVPDYNGRSPGSAGAPFQRGDGTGINPGRITESQNKAHTHTRGDMNISGSIETENPIVEWGGNLVNQGAISLESTKQLGASNFNIPATGGFNKIRLDASKSWTGKTSSNGGDEARPLNVTGVWALKVYDRLIDPSSIDVNEALTELANVKAELANYQGAAVQVGTIQWHASDVVPFGYLMCDGSQVSRTVYPDLYAAIGDTFGAGNGIDTFNLPDLINEFVRGFSPASRPVGTKQGDAIRNFLAEFSIATYADGGSTPIVNTGSGAISIVKGHGPNGSPLSVGTPTSSMSRVSINPSLAVPTADENRPRNVSMMPMIKAYSHIINPGALDLADLSLRVHNLEGHWENSREVCLVHAEGTGHPHEFVTDDIPDNIVTNTRYLIQNPFGKNTPVIVVAEILVNGAWCDPQFAMADQNSGYGVKASYKQEEGIILQTGDAPLSLLVQNGQCGTGHNNPPATPTAPCRIRVIKTV